ncbi:MULTISPECIES: translation initiation factor IF-2 [Tenacibaculum]|uniref:Translation initiation factor IF-2 n=2 Tax=Tenacibaculum TaxID=104267 RepID=A0AAE9MPK5_9FLAO|nr:MULTISPECIES: translation initiation factor IF-2 [Tenacibaculum]GFD78493.1 translation initiation factor IF-2 [Tenacibaculum sp. KUL118]GFD91307.1 translation initiation factor IF-2 [Alteromonas sp. KUL154]GFE00821.1 translation initiation factor IF-2 [Alteromonas sp. KUL156]AZJ33245.1 translation initiation factor IF-2 [Tenacibaculum mesophilum]MCG7500496.1 translation initiation factor IF-2 [Tenacibaculum sp. Mcav3-52]|eukprot:TRINITY_DN178_c0_g7_i1.p1 TRINITY_DN178_c0_g7~~TRINITY_DN178_c0_g7_i1.p1  ORF type:complete len:952 (-),score=289.56 TRINITY_DN178_c0_g7_i1:1118-3973(-)
MAEGKKLRLNKVLRELNISLDRAVEHLAKNGYEIEARPTTKISDAEYQILFDGFQTDKSKKVASKEVSEEKKKEKEAIRQQLEQEQERKRLEEEAKKQEVLKAKAEKLELKTVGKIDVETGKAIEEVAEEVKPEPTKKEEKIEEPKKEEPIKPVQETKKVEEPVKVEEKKPEPPKTEKPKEQTVNTPKKEVKKEQPKEVKKTVENKVKEVKQPVKEVEITPENAEKIKTQYKKLEGPNFTGQKIDLKQFERPKKKKPEANKADGDKKKRKRISKPGSPGTGAKPQGNNRGGQNRGGQRGGNRGGQRGRRPAAAPKEELTEAQIQKQVRETLEKLQGKSKKGKGAKYRRDKRDAHRQQSEAELQAAQAESKVLKVTEFVTVSEVATMMDVPVTQIISTCMMLGMMVTMNQRLDAETLQIVAEEFNYTVEFVGAEVEESIEEVEDKPEDLITRAPIITVMGHVDHGKTSLLDYIRNANVIEGESGGITQHIGAYAVKVGEHKIAFLDTPGHEAFTAMRARGAQVTDLVIIVVAADDDVMPQTKEAISHAQAAGVPIIFAINKIDKPNANPDNIKTQLSSMNLLVEDWGGNIQSQEISAKTGQGVDELLEKVLLEAEVLELKANPNKNANGAVVEALLDKGRGYVSTILVQAGTLKIGDYILAGKHSGKVRAMFDDKGRKVKEAGPSTPVSILGLDGAPQAGDKFNVFEDEREAKQIAAKRSQLQREQSVRTQKTLTLAEIGRRIALGDFKELNIILKGDVDGSVEALTDSFQKLSTEEIQVNIIHKGVGAITESDVLLATASDAIIVGFNVRPQGNARSVADREEVDIRTYSIIYDAINDLKDAMEGMLSPEMKEEVLGNVEIREVYKISKIGNIAGCMVMTGKITRDSKVRVIRDGIVVHDGVLASLKRFKDDVKEVTKGYDCGLQIKGYNDIKEGDTLEAYTEVAVKKKLK